MKIEKRICKNCAYWKKNCGDGNVNLNSSACRLTASDKGNAWGEKKTGGLGTKAFATTLNKDSKDVLFLNCGPTFGCNQFRKIPKFKCEVCGKEARYYEGGPDGSRFYCSPRHWKKHHSESHRKGIVWRSTFFEKGFPDYIIDTRLRRRENDA